MIRPKPRPGSAKPRGIAVGLTIALLVGAQAGLQGLSVPAFASSRSVIRELDPLMLERFALPPTPESVPEDDAVAEDAAEPEEVVSLSFDEEVGMAMEQLEELFGAEETPAAVAERAGDEAGEPAAPGIAADVPEERFESLFGATGSVLPGRAGARRPSASRAAGAGIGVGIEERRVEDEPAAAGSRARGPDVAVRTSTDRAGVEQGEELAIAPHQAEAFDESAAGRLGAWMRSNPAELPVGVRVHMNYEPSFLTATSVFASEGRSWELYLMFNESLAEVHVVLIEGNESVYLIDRGFQEQSRSLREGLVRRSGGQVVAIDSRSGAASGERSREFYDVFLSWWAATDGAGG